MRRLSDRDQGLRWNVGGNPCHLADDAARPARPHRSAKL